MGKRKPLDEQTVNDAMNDAGDKPEIRLAEHPGAARSIPRVRAWAGLSGFVLAALLGNQAGLPFIDLVLRALLIGTACLLVAWVVAQAVWKQIVFAEIAAARKRAREAHQALLDELEQRADGAA